MWCRQDLVQLQPTAVATALRNTQILLEQPARASQEYSTTASGYVHLMTRSHDTTIDKHDIKPTRQSQELRYAKVSDDST